MSIAPQFHTYVEARLGRWRLWCYWGARPGPKNVISWYGPLIIDPNVEQLGLPDTACPVDIDEAEETQKSVMALDPELRELIVMEYLSGVTVSVSQKMKSLGFKSRQTYYNRLYRAYGDLLGFFNDLAADVPLPAPRAK